jgi:integrase
MTLDRSILAANKVLAGSFSSKHTRQLICLNFVEWLAGKGITIEKIQNATPEHIVDYVQYRSKGNQEQGIRPLSTGSLKNIQSALNQMVNAHRPKSSSRRLHGQIEGVGKRDRTGSKRPPTEAEFAQIMLNAQALDEPGFAVMLQLERLLGLRAQEALRFLDALQRYQKLNVGVAQVRDLIDVYDGTKGGRARTTQMIQSRKAETLEVIQQALSIGAAQGGVLLKGKKAGLNAARQRYHYLCKKVGLVGDISGHSLRYLYATDKLHEQKALGMTRKEAAQWVARVLGHGASRDRYVRMVYGRSAHSID